MAEKMKIIPLGGLDEVGKNMTVYEFGGEIITVGSDGHKPEHLAYDFHKVPSILKEAGFHYYTIFKNRKPEFIRL